MRKKHYTFVVLLVLMILCITFSNFSPLDLHEQKNVRRQQICMNKSAKDSIFYIKVQKTGSTSVKSLLFNYAMKKNLDVCFDSEDIHHMNFPYPIDIRKLTTPLNKKCDVIAEEMIYNRNVLSKLMRNSVFVMSSIRDPVAHFISMFKFARVQHAVEMFTLNRGDVWDSMRTFFKYPQLVMKVFTTFKEKEINTEMLLNLVRPNLQSFSFGLMENATKEEIIHRAKEIDFIVVAEHFEESMVLLSKELCCDLNDLVFVRQNIRARTSEDEEIPPEDVVALIHEFNGLDVILYKIALERMKKSIQQYTNFERDLSLYKEILKKYSMDCKGREPLAKINNNHCLQEGATYFYQIVREKQKKKLLKSLQQFYQELQ